MSLHDQLAIAFFGLIMTSPFWVAYLVTKAWLGGGEATHWENRRYGYDREQDRHPPEIIAEFRRLQSVAAKYVGADRVPFLSYRDLRAYDRDDKARERQRRAAYGGVRIVGKAVVSDVPQPAPPPPPPRAARRQEKRNPKSLQDPGPLDTGRWPFC